jgi:hypothetical protein
MNRIRNMGVLAGIAGLVTMALLMAGTATATTSGPAVGDWSGHITSASPATGMSFSVHTPAAGAQIADISATGSFAVPCDPAFAPVEVSGIPIAKLYPDGSFAASSSVTENLITITTTVAGTFKNEHSAAGTVTIVLGDMCTSTLRWNAAWEPPSPPVPGASYRGTTGIDQAGGGLPVTFKVSADGKRLTSVKFSPPIEFNGSCVTPLPIATVIGLDVPIRGGTFRFRAASATITDGAGTTNTEIVTGRFLGGRQASGTVVSMTNEAGVIHCSGSNTWTAVTARSPSARRRPPRRHVQAALPFPSRSLRSTRSSSS